jgi:chemotaxis protein histidine kinase CheA
MGIRPDEPDPTVARDRCGEYQEYVKYAQQLQEAYQSRASQNRWWIYVAAVTGLGAAAATGGLAAAGAAGVGTLALLGISGGFAAATFGTIDNTELAKMYAHSANSVDRAIQKANVRFNGMTRFEEAEAKRARLKRQLDKAEKEAAAATGAARAEADARAAKAKADFDLADQALETERKAMPAGDATVRCVDALVHLRADITKTRSKLELLRTNTASGALARAQEERKALDEIIKQFAPPSEDVEETTPPAN